jgi:hypothetical protein
MYSKNCSRIELGRKWHEWGGNGTNWTLPHRGNLSQGRQPGGMVVWLLGVEGIGRMETEKDP